MILIPVDEQELDFSLKQKWKDMNFFCDLLVWIILYVEFYGKHPQNPYEMVEE